MQEQFDDDPEALRTQNDPERKSQREASPRRRLQSQDTEDEKDQDGDKDKGDPRGAHGRISGQAEISKESDVDQPDKQPNCDGESGSAVQVANA